MNGVRSTYKRKGYLLTALAAAVLLAASSGTAYGAAVERRATCAERPRNHDRACRGRWSEGARRDNHRARQGKCRTYVES